MVRVWFRCVQHLGWHSGVFFQAYLLRTLNALGEPAFLYGLWGYNSCVIALLCVIALFCVDVGLDVGRHEYWCL